MARARNIKPGFLKNEELCELPPLARLLFAGLWMLADREGRLEDRPKRIKAECLPYDTCDVDDLLWLLDERGFIIRYEVGEYRFVQIPKFSDHQHPHANETVSRIPELSEGCKVSRNGTKDSHQIRKDSGKALTDSGLISDCLISDSLLSDSLNPSTRTECSESAPTLFPINGNGKSHKPEKATQIEDELAEQYATEIHARHPKLRRDCGVKAVAVSLRTILRACPKSERPEKMRLIDEHHRGWCESDAWTHDNGEFAKALSNWLAPTKGRFDSDPPPRAGPGAPSSEFSRRSEGLRRYLDESTE